MKKYILLSAIAFASLGTLTSCVDRTNDVVQTTDNDTYPVMKDITGTFNAGNNFTISQPITIPTTDVVLVYRNVSTTGTAVWQMIPKTFYIKDATGLPVNRELDYNFDFTTKDVQIYTQANFNQSTEINAAETNQYLTNQTFRIVLVPASKGKNANLNYSDYDSVVRYYNLDDSNVKGF